MSATCCVEATVTATVAQLRAVLAFADDDPSRSISRVCLEPSHGRIIATDGHALVVVGRDVEAPDAPDTARWLVFATDVIAALRGRKPGAAVTLHCTEDSVVAECDGTTAVIARDRAEYPPVRSVVPSWAPAETPAGRWRIDTRYLAKIDVLARATCAHKEWPLGVEIRTPGDVLSPVRFDLPDRKGMVVVMPMRL